MPGSYLFCMNKRHTLFHIAYALVFILVLLAQFKQWSLLNEIATPFITVTLLLLLSSVTKLKGRFHQRLFTGLVFALTGNTLILMQNHHQSYFLYGVIALLICAVFYISAFYLDFRSAQELDKRGAKIAIFSTAILCIAFYLFLRPHLGALKLPVIIYVLLMGMMMMMAAFRNQRVNSTSFKLVLAGVLFFVLSGALLACRYFVNPFKYADAYIVSTYMIAQYLIILGGTKRALLRKLSD